MRLLGKKREPRRHKGGVLTAKANVPDPVQWVRTISKMSRKSAGGK